MTYAEPAVSSAALTPYLGRLVKFRTMDDDNLRVGFLNAIRNGLFIFDDSEPVSQSRVLAAYNIVGELIAGKEI